MRRAISVGTILFATGCGGSGWLDGAGFDVADAVFETRSMENGDRSVTTVVVSDAAGLCDRVASGEALAGHRELRVRRWNSGATEVELRSYDDDCTILESERAHQSWIDLRTEGFDRVSLDLVFRTPARSVSGEISADWCTLPEPARIGCR